MKKNLIRIVALFFYGLTVLVGISIILMLISWILGLYHYFEFYLGEVSNLPFIVKAIIFIAVGYLFEIYLKRRLKR